MTFSLPPPTRLKLAVEEPRLTTSSRMPLSEEDHGDADPKRSQEGQRKRRGLKSRIKKSEREVKKQRIQNTVSNNLHAMSIRLTVLPVVAGVMYKAIFQTARRRETRTKTTDDPRLRYLRENQDNFAWFGMPSVQEMKILIDTVCMEILEFCSVFKF